MIVNVQPDPDPRVTQVRECLKRILASPQFERSDRSRRMLEFLVETALSGQSADFEESGSEWASSIATPATTQRPTPWSE